MKELVEYMARSLVDQPEAVLVTAEEQGDDVHLQLQVAPEDMGKVIGKQGRIAKALRTVVKALASKQGKNVDLVIG